MTDRPADDREAPPPGAELLGGRWPEDKPFPLTDAECAEIIRGGMVRWRGTFDDFDLLPGKFEMINGWVYLWRC
jgi:hypothetical protein